MVSLVHKENINNEDWMRMVFKIVLARKPTSAVSTRGRYQAGQLLNN